MKTITKAQFVELMNNGDWKTESGYELFPGEQAGDMYSVGAWVTSKTGDIAVTITLNSNSDIYESDDVGHAEVEVFGVQVVDANGDNEYLYVDDLPAKLRDVDIKYVLEEARKSYKTVLETVGERH